ncbi:MAG: lipid-transfer protein [Myxococcota bacterium]
MPTTIHNEAAVAGIGQTAYTKKSGVSELSLATEAVRKAIDDAGLRPSDVDGLVTYTMDSSDEVEVARTVGIGDMTFWSKVNYGGGAAVGLVAHAAMAVATGMAKNVVVYRALNGRSGQRMGQGVSGQIISSDLIHWSWYMPFGLLTPASWIALQAKLYMQKYGATSEHLAHIAITQRKHAQNNPNAAMRGKPMTMDDYMNARMICEPLRLFDCCQGGRRRLRALITSAERARHEAEARRDPRRHPGLLRGQEQMTSFYRDDLAALPEMELAAKIIYEQSGLGAKDIDAACLYDAFTPRSLSLLGAASFCGKGEAKDFVTADSLTLGGALPNNTHGGLLSEAYLHGVNNLAEGVRLIRGTSCNQPEGVDHVLVTSGVGVPTGAVIFGQA